MHIHAITKHESTPDGKADLSMQPALFRGVTKSYSAFHVRRYRLFAITHLPHKPYSRDWRVGWNET